MGWFWETRPNTTPSQPTTHADRDTTTITTATTLTSKYLQPETLLPTIVITSTLLTLLHLRRKYLLRIPTAPQIPQSYFGTATKPPKPLFGRVVSVGDADNFRLYHTPGGVLGGWNWLRRVPPSGTRKKEGSANVTNTIHVRIAGVDAPELPHFGKPGQPGGEKALEWLRGAVNGRNAWVYCWRMDQYGRVVGTAWIRRAGSLGCLMPRGWGCWDVGEAMLRAGWAVVYQGGKEAEFGGKEDVYKSAEARSKKERKGLWATWRDHGDQSVERGVLSSLWGKVFGEETQEEWESPRDFKRRTKAMEEGMAGPAKNATTSKHSKG